MTPRLRSTTTMVLILFAALVPLGCRGKTHESKTTHPDSTAVAPVGAIAYYTCPMHPSIRSEQAGHCPICGMTLVAVTQEELHTGTITLSAERRQEIGVRVGQAEMKPVQKTLRAVGRIAYDETGLAEVSTKVGGWIETLYADATGMKVNRGSALFTIYSPELYSAQEEYLTALKSQATARQSPASDRADYLVEAARNRLRLL